MRGVISHWHSPKVWFQNFGLGETDSKGPHGWHFYTMGTLLEKAQHENVSEVDSHFVMQNRPGEQQVQVRVVHKQNTFSCFTRGILHWKA